MKNASVNGKSHLIVAPFAEGTALPLTFDPPSPAPPCEPKTVQKHLSARMQRRSAEACRHGDAYVRERFCPGPTSRFPKLWPSCQSASRFKLSSLFLGDIEKEKRRLQNIMSTGQEEPAPVAPGRAPDPDTEDRDRFQEGINNSAKMIFPVEAFIPENADFLLQFWVRSRRGDSFWLTWPLWARERNTSTSSTQRFLR